MLNRLVTVLIIIPVAIVLIAFSVANRAPAVVSLDPFNPANPALSWSAPMFLWLSAALVIGVLVGGVASWFAQGHHRKAERAYRKEAKSLRSETEELKKQVGATSPGLPAVRA